MRYLATESLIHTKCKRSGRAFVYLFSQLFFVGVLDFLFSTAASIVWVENRAEPVETHDHPQFEARRSNGWRGSLR